jgi:hypothetical protein
MSNPKMSLILEGLDHTKKLPRENTEKVNEKHSIGGGSGKWVQRNILYGGYCGNGGRSWVPKDSKRIDTWDTEEEAKADGLENYEKSFKFGIYWDVVQL